MDLLSSTLFCQKYLHGDQPYALVTGATDGIGKAVAKQLYRQGFNLIIHGRNEKKTKQVVDEIRALGAGRRDIHYFLADATKHGWHDSVFPFKNLNISIVVSNVGECADKSIQVRSALSALIIEFVAHWNALFPLHIIQTLLPQLRRVNGLALVLNVGSYAGETPPPRLAIYAASKRFVNTLGWALSIDERYYTPTNVEFMYLVVGEVSTNSVQKEATLFCPNADTFARWVIARIGCGRRQITPYIFHAVAQWLIESCGKDMAVKIIAEVMRQLYYSDKKEE
ncbi:hypothetical protein M422DRAFT_153177 [Sphaerobolus stellatus SS14]|nr:hypothetical protein M422DRAFT_153177 [Sphaerobolus stellatus SS14]